MRSREDAHVASQRHAFGGEGPVFLSTAEDGLCCEMTTGGEGRLVRGRRRTSAVAAMGGAAERTHEQRADSGLRRSAPHKCKVDGESKIMESEGFSQEHVEAQEMRLFQAADVATSTQDQRNVGTNTS